MLLINTRFSYYSAQGAYERGQRTVKKYIAPPIWTCDESPPRQYLSPLLGLVIMVGHNVAHPLLFHFLASTSLRA